MGNLYEIVRKYSEFTQRNQSNPFDVRDTSNANQ